MNYSYTQISQYLTCPRRYRYRYLDGWKPQDNRPAMLFGRAFEQVGDAGPEAAVPNRKRREPRWVHGPEGRGGRARRRPGPEQASVHPEGLEDVCLRELVERGSRRTLDDRGESRGLSFDREMLPHCGRTYRVKTGVRRIIDEKDGRMLKIPRDCVILDDVYCSGELSVCGRWFCPRGIYPFWRESWLERVDDAARP